MSYSYVHGAYHNLLVTAHSKQYFNVVIFLSDDTEPLYARTIRRHSKFHNFAQCLLLNEIKQMFPCRSPANATFDLHVFKLAPVNKSA